MVHFILGASDRIRCFIHSFNSQSKCFKNINFIFLNHNSKGFVMRLLLLPHHIFLLLLFTG